MSEQMSQQYWKNYYSREGRGSTDGVNAASSTRRSPHGDSSSGGHHPHHSGTNNDRQYYHCPPSGFNFDNGISNYDKEHISHGNQKDPVSSRPNSSDTTMTDTTTKQPHSLTVAGGSSSNLETSAAFIQNENSRGRNNVTPVHQNTIGRYQQQLVPTSDHDMASTNHANHNYYYHYANSNRMSQGDYRRIDDTSSHYQQGRTIPEHRFLDRSNQYSSSHRMDSTTNDATEHSRYYDKSAGHSYYYEASNLDHSHHRHYDDDRMKRNTSRYAFEHSKMNKRTNHTSSFASSDIVSSESPDYNYKDAPSSCRQVTKSDTNISSHPFYQQHSSMGGDRPRIRSFNHNWDHHLRPRRDKIYDGGNVHHTQNFNDVKMNSSRNEGGDQHYGYGSISSDGRFYPRGRSLEGPTSTPDDVRECKDAVVGDNSSGQESDKVRRFTTPNDITQVVGTTTNNQEQQDTGSYNTAKVSDDSPDDASKHHGLIDDKNTVQANTYEENKEVCKAVNNATVSDKNTTRKSLWKCDICLVARFLNYDDAIKHEKQCRGSKEQERIKAISMMDETTPNGRIGWMSLTKAKDVADDSKKLPQTAQTTSTIEVEKLSLDCHHCEKSFSSLQNLIAHKSKCLVHSASLTHNSSDETPQGLYICDFCSKGFATYLEADEHEKNCSSRQQKSTCFTRNSKKVTDVKSFTCHICSASFSTYTEGKIHERKCSKQIAKSISNCSNMIQDSQEGGGERTASDSNAGGCGTFIDSSICKQVERNHDHANTMISREKLYSGQQQLDHNFSDPASIINTNKGYQLNNIRENISTDTIPIIEKKLMLVDDSMMESTKRSFCNARSGEYEGPSDGLNVNQHLVHPRRQVLQSQQRIQDQGQEEQEEKLKCVEVALQRDTSQQQLKESNKRISEEVHSTDSPFKHQKLGNNNRLCIRCDDGSSTLLPPLDSVPLVASFFSIEISQLSETSRTLLNHIEIIDKSKFALSLRCRCCNSDEYTEPFSKQINSVETMHETIDRFRFHLKNCKFFPQKGDGFTLVKPKKRECMKLMSYCKLLSEAYGIVNNFYKGKGVTWGSSKFCLSEYNSSPGELVRLEKRNSGTKSTVANNTTEKITSDVARLKSNVAMEEQYVNTETLTEKRSGSGSILEAFLLTDHNYIIVRSLVFIRKYCGKSSATGSVNINLYSKCRHCAQIKPIKSIEKFTSERVHQYHRHFMNCKGLTPRKRKILEDCKDIHHNQKRANLTTSVAEYGRQIVMKLYGIHDTENSVSQRCVLDEQNIEDGVHNFGRKLNDSKLPRNWVKLEMELPFYLKDYAFPVSSDLPGKFFGSSDR